MIWYQVHAYTSTDNDHDIETFYEGRSLKKAYKEFEKSKKYYPMVRIDEWQGDEIGDGDYTRDVECWIKEGEVMK